MSTRQPSAATIEVSLQRRITRLPHIAGLVCLVWIVMLIGLSVSPLSFKLKLHTVGPYHDFWHYIVYIVTSILLCVVARGLLARTAAFVAVIGIAFGQEWLENHMYHAGYEWRDVGTDLAGIISGFALATLVSVLMSDSQTSR